MTLLQPDSTPRQPLSQVVVHPTNDDDDDDAQEDLLHSESDILLPQSVSQDGYASPSTGLLLLIGPALIAGYVGTFACFVSHVLTFSRIIVKAFDIAFLSTSYARIGV